MAEVGYEYRFSSQIPPGLRRAIYNTSWWYRDTGVGTFVTEDVKELSEKTSLYLTGKQVPSCLLLRNSGHWLTTKNRNTLAAAGFPLCEKYGDDGDWIPVHIEADPWTEEGHVSASRVKGFSDYLSSIVAENARLGRDDLASDAFVEAYPETVAETSVDSSEEEFQEENDLWEQPGGKTARYTYKVDYQDPFKVQAAYHYALGRGKTPPKVYVWDGDLIRLTDSIPKKFLGAGYTGKRGTTFQSLASPDVKLHVLRNQTHWGKLLSAWLSDNECQEHKFAVRLWRKVKAFLRGEPDPDRKRDGAEVLGGKPPSIKSRSSRFIQMLVTIDGAFVQKFLAHPGAEWTWERFDRFVLTMIHILLPEEFIDGEIEEKDLNSTKTAYETLKSTRQAFKSAAMKGDVQELVERLKSEKDPVARIFVEDYKQFSLIKDPYERAQVLGILSQTRGCGTPPPLVVMRSKMKFIATITTEPEPYTEMERALVDVALEQLLAKAPDEAFLGLQTKIGVRIATSASYERTREEGGTADAINEIVADGTLGRKCYTYDLEYGVKSGEMFLSDCTPGEYIFWRCLEVVLATDLEALRKVYLVTVKEPGKARSVTKGLAALKVVLDLVNGWVSWPLGKAFPSSSSGMEKESHGWNFFKDLVRDEELCFEEIERSDKQVAVGIVHRTVTYGEVFLGSTDYKTATDFLRHEVASQIGEKWMLKCGVPPLLRGIVHATCYHPRTVEFAATGCLSRVGDPTDRKDVRKVTLVTGVLMGDPLTKVVLHLVNMTVRQISLGLIKDPGQYPSIVDYMSAVKRIVQA